MWKRLLVTLAVLALVIGTLGYLKYSQIRTAIEQGKSFTPPPEAITTIVTREEAVEPVLNAVGSLAAVNGVVVSTDLPGIVQKIDFESGRPVKEGELLVQLDTRQEVAQLRASEAKRELARTALERNKELWAKRVSAKSEFDAANAEFQQADAAVQEVRAMIERKMIRAPFSGILGIRQVNLGQYLKSGDLVVPLQSLDPIYVNFSLPQQELHRIYTGVPVRVRAGGLPGEKFTGEVTAINSVVDEATRNIQVQATVPNPGLRLRPGMFVDVEVPLPQSESVILLPATAINYAPYGDSVWVVEESAGSDGKKVKTVRQQFVKLGASRGDQIAVLSGIEPGVEVATSGVFKLRPGGAVFVDNTAQPSNEASPEPADS